MDSINKNRIRLICKNYLIPLCLLMFLSCNINRKKHDNTEVFFEKTEFDFGEIPADKNISIAFRFSNSGKKPLIIKNIVTSCDCTVPKWKKGKILPGESGEIKVNINPTYRGMFYSSVEVFYNGINSPQKLKIKGMIEYLSLLD